MTKAQLHHKVIETPQSKGGWNPRFEIRWKEEKIVCCDGGGPTGSRLLLEIGDSAPVTTDQETGRPRETSVTCSVCRKVHTADVSIIELPNPPCAACRHLGESVRHTIDRQSWKLLNRNHGIEAHSCTHPSALIARGNGEFDNERENRRTFCGHQGRFFSELQEEQRLSRRMLRVERIGPELLMGGLRKVRVRVEELGKGHTATMTGEEIELRGIVPNGTAHARVALTRDGQVTIEDWEPRNGPRR